MVWELLEDQDSVVLIHIHKCSRRHCLDGNPEEVVGQEEARWCRARNRSRKDEGAPEEEETSLCRLYVSFREEDGS